MLLKSGTVAGAAVITTLTSNITRMAPCVVHMDGVATTLAAGIPTTARWKWNVSGPSGWSPRTCSDPRDGIDYGTTIRSDLDCEGFNFAFYADVAGTYVVSLFVTDQSGGTYVARQTFVIAADTRTSLYVSGTGNDSTGDGSIGNPWRQPSKAWDYIIANGKTNFSIFLEKGYSYQGFGNESGLLGDAVNIVISSYGSGATPIVKYGGSYVADTLLTFTACEAIVVRGINFKGDDATVQNGFGITANDECLNMAFVDLEFGGPGGADCLSYGFLSNANNPRTTVPAYQGRGYSFFNCSGHTSAYFCFCDAPDTKGAIIGTDFTPTASAFECDGTSLSSVDGAYDGMQVTVASNNSSRSEKRVVSSYVANAGNGRPKFTLASPFSAAPVAGDVVYVVDIDVVGDSYIFFFGTTNVATANKGTEARVRLINANRAAFVGTSLDGSTTALSQKDTYRMMVTYLYVYRCASLNGPFGFGADIGSEGIGPYTYQVVDRSFLEALDGGGGASIPVAFTFCVHAMLKASVLKGDMLNTSSQDGSLIGYSQAYNSAGDDVRITQCTMFSNRQRACIVDEGTDAGWPDDFITFENNLIARNHVGSHDMIKDWATPTGAYASSKNNVYCPDQLDNGAFDVNTVSLTLAGWNLRTGVLNDVWGSITPDVLVAAGFIPNPATYVPETTNRDFTTPGVFQDYYGNNPVGGAYVGAVSRSPSS